MKKILKYNKIIEDIVFDYVQRLYKEEKVWEEPEKSDYRIMNYTGVSIWPLELWDRYISIEDLLICEYNQFPTISLLDWCDYELDRHTNNFERITNYYNYTKNIWNTQKIQEQKK